MTCPVCGEGRLIEMTEQHEGVTLLYSLCDHCGSDIATHEQHRANIQAYKEAKA